MAATDSVELLALQRIDETCMQLQQQVRLRVPPHRLCYSCPMLQFAPILLRFVHMAALFFSRLSKKPAS